MNRDFTPPLHKLYIEILKAHRMVLDSKWKYENMCAPFTRLYFVKKGKGYIIHGDKQIDIQDEHVYIIPAGCTVSFGCKYLEKIWFHIRLTGTEMADLFSVYPTIDSLPFSASSYEKLYQALSSNDNIQFLSVYTLLYETMFSFAEKYSPRISAPTKNYSDLTTRLLGAICEHPKITLTTRELSKKLFVSPSTAHVTFREEVGKTIKQYIDEMVFAEAKKLLLNPSLSIDDISERLGFCNRNYFTTRFNKVCGMTPAAYRRIALPNT